DHHVGRLWKPLCDRPGGGHADDELTAGDKKLLCDENGEGRSDRAPDNAEAPAALVPLPQIGVKASPGRTFYGAALALRESRNVAIGIKQANGRDRRITELLLLPCLAQQVLGQKNGWLAMVLPGEKRRLSQASLTVPAADGVQIR